MVNSEADTVNSIRHLIRRSREVLSLWQILDDNEFHLVVERLSQVSVKDIGKSIFLPSIKHVKAQLFMKLKRTK